MWCGAFRGCSNGKNWTLLNNVIEPVFNQKIKSERGTFYNRRDEIYVYAGEPETEATNKQDNVRQERAGYRKSHPSEVAIAMRAIQKQGSVVAYTLGKQAFERQRKKALRRAKELCQAYLGLEATTIVATVPHTSFKHNEKLDVQVRKP
mmetsp:Transcript_86010/g.179862  ORF Transcript_86010/g.179862 Transcript_86010/m.179862 type:complete len:149 (-) Transcript_86010:132-578(-)